MSSKRDAAQIKLRLPQDLKQWVGQQAELNRSTQNSEVVRAVRERKERCEQRPAP